MTGFLRDTVYLTVGVFVFWFLVYTTVKLARLAYLSATRQFENDHQTRDRRPFNGQGKRQA